MTAKMTQADFDAMFEAAAAAGLVDSPIHDPKAAKLQRDQDTARLSVEAEEELREQKRLAEAARRADALAELLGDMPPAKGSWEVTEGDPPKVAFTWGSDRYEGEITSLTADSVTIDYGDETVTAERRSSSATCD